MHNSQVHSTQVHDSQAHSTQDHGSIIHTASTQPASPALGAVAGNTFLESVLAPYSKKNCVYVTSVERIVGGGLGATLEARCSIPTSCYIDDTGHFNSVEFNICFNQMMYILIADSVARGAFPELGSWRHEDFLTRQLSHLLIVRLQTRFLREIDPRGFTGSCSIDRVIQRGKGPLWLKTSGAFADAHGGAADGKVDVAILS